MCLKREHVSHTKYPFAEWDDRDGKDEFDWYDFKYAIGLKAASKLNEFCRATIFTIYPSSGNERMVVKHFKLEPDRDAAEYGEQVLNALFKNIRTLQVFALTNRPGLVFLHKHHDNPVNGDLIVVTQCSEKTYRRYAK